MIKGLSDKLRLPRRGKIRLGEKKVSEKSGKEYPVSLDYFVVPDEVKSIYGAKPRKLDIMLPMEETESFFPQNYKRYGSSAGLLCKGNGEVATEMDTEKMKEIECLGKDCEWYKKNDCKQIGNFQVILPKIKGLGVYQIDTSSYNSIINLNSGIEMIRGMLGRVSWIPLVLEVRIQEAHPLVGGKKIKTTIPVMSITADLTVYDMLKLKSSIPAQQVAIDNPKVDEKDDLLYPNLEKKGSVAIAKESEEKDRTTIDKIGETEVKGESKDKALSEEEAQKEQDELLRRKESEKKGRNELNIRWHSLKKKCFEANYFSDDESYRAWIMAEFGNEKKSSKDLAKMQLILGIGKMAKILNDYLEKEHN